jgi:hypothetical protein
LNLKKSGRKTLHKYSNIVLILDISQVPEKDYDFWVVAFHDENDEYYYTEKMPTNQKFKEC